MANSQNTQFKFGVIGLGVTGKSVCKYLKSIGLKALVINSGKVENWAGPELENFTCISQEDSNLSNYLDKTEAIILSPGIPRNAAFLQSFKGEIINDIELFFRMKKTNPIIIGITGSNGKTTTVTLLDEIIKAANKSVFCGGNIGLSPMEFLLNGEKEEIVLLELSSFQLESVKNFQCDMAAVLNVTMTHEERYKTENDYRQAKLNIFQHQHQNGLYLIDHATKKYCQNQNVFVFNEESSLQDLQKKFDFKSWMLPGKHNLLNLKVCVDIAEHLKIEKKVIQQVINSFKGVSDRIEFIGKVNEIPVYNDSKSTNIYSTLTAIKAFDGKNVAVILGGQIRDRQNLNLTGLKEISELASSLVLFGEVSTLKELSTSFRFEKLKNLDFSFLNSKTEIILFSPGFPSFDEFNNYHERGDCFKKIFASELVEK